MASLQAEHSQQCALGRIWTPLDGESGRCTCGGGGLEAGSAGNPASNGRTSPSDERRPAPSLSVDDEPRLTRDVSFGDWADRWLAGLERKPSTVASYRSTMAHARCAFGSMDVRKIGPEDVADFNQSLRRLGCSPSTRAKHLRVLGACLQAAVTYRFAESNAVRDLPRAQKPRPESKEAAYFENSELPRLFASLTEEPYRTLCLVALKTGMRQGELIALRWDDLDLGEAVIRVRRSYTGGELGTPKNRERRDVDLISDVVNLLLSWRRQQQANGEELVFHEASHRFLSPTILLRRKLYPAMNAAGIDRVGPTQERRTFHSFRHTFAKRALENGAQITWLSRHLGHSSLKVTTDVYGHWERAERKLQVAKMEGVFTV